MIRPEDRPKSSQSQFPNQFHCRTRHCLRKGCGRAFRACHPASRYCSDECRQEVRRWQNRRYGQRYRKTGKGKAKRSSQARNRRRRVKEQKRTEYTAAAGSVGQHNEQHQGVICARPGCYEYVLPTRHSPGQKYCSKPCSSAMRCVSERERRWRERLKQRNR